MFVFKIMIEKLFAYELTFKRRSKNKQKITQYFTHNNPNWNPLQTSQCTHHQWLQHISPIKSTNPTIFVWSTHNVRRNSTLWAIPNSLRLSIMLRSLKNTRRPVSLPLIVVIRDQHVCRAVLKSCFCASFLTTSRRRRRWRRADRYPHAVAGMPQRSMQFVAVVAARLALSRNFLSATDLACSPISLPRWNCITVMRWQSLLPSTPRSCVQTHSDQHFVDRCLGQHHSSHRVSSRSLYREHGDGRQLILGVDGFYMFSWRAHATTVVVQLIRNETCAKKEGTRRYRGRTQSVLQLVLFVMA